MNSNEKRWFQENAPRFAGQLTFDETLARHTYYRIGGPADVFAVPNTLADLQWLSEAIQKTGIRRFVLGQGTNILVSDSGFKGLVVKVHGLNLEIGLVPHNSSLSQIHLRTGGSVAVSTLLRRAAQEGWGGLEFLTGIPGSVGGVVAMNAGTHLGETQNRISRVEVYPLKNQDAESVFSTYRGEQLRFEYRKNLFLPEGAIIWSAEWVVSLSDPSSVKKTINETLARRKATQPVNYPSCGSVFKNPKQSGFFAWQVIDRLGLRGHRIGDAQFAEKHSNFIVNLGLAKASDVLSLIRLAQSRAEKELGIFLEQEVIYLE